MSDANKTLVRRMVDEVINQRRFDLLDELCMPALARKFERSFREFETAFPDWREEVIDLVAEDDRVAGHFTCSGTQKGPFMNQPATGRQMEGVHEVFFFTVKEGRLATAWSLEDTWERMRQLGHFG